VVAVVGEFVVEVGWQLVLTVDGSRQTDRAVKAASPRHATSGRSGQPPSWGRPELNCEPRYDSS
jgi:hypothetical protein